MEKNLPSFDQLGPDQQHHAVNHIYDTLHAGLPANLTPSKLHDILKKYPIPISLDASTYGCNSGHLRESLKQAGYEV